MIRPRTHSAFLARLAPLVAVLALFADSTPIHAQRPEVEIASTESFDAAEVPAYRGDHARIYAHIDANVDAHRAELQRWVRQRSVSAQDDGIRTMARLLRQDLVELGFVEAELVPTGGHPGVWGYYDAGADRTLLIYLMYDVQPVNPEDWRVDPFAGELVDVELGRALMARGATNQKGPERAFLNALASILAVEGELPVNLMVAAEGEEELGSPHYPEVIDAYEARMRTADGVFFPFNSQGVDGDVQMFLGVKGMLYFEMEAVGGPEGGPTRAEIHGSYKAIVDAPAWRLVQALSTLTSDDGNTITVPGYYDAVRDPTPEEERLINGLAPSWAENERAMMDGLGVEQWIEDVGPRESLLRYLYHPTLNIDGIWGGYTGPGVKTILPHRATAKVDSRLVPDMTPERQLRLIREHLDRNGFHDITIRQLSGYPPAQSSVDAPLVRAAIGVYNKHGIGLTVLPRLAGSAPYYVFTDRLGLPMVAGGIGFGTGAHAPDEYMLIEPAEGSPIAGLAEIEKFYVDLLYALAESR